LFKYKVLEMENYELLTPEYDEISLKTRKLATLGLLPAKAINKEIIQPIIPTPVIFCYILPAASETHEQLTSEGFIILPVSVINIVFGPCYLLKFFKLFSLK